MRAILYAAEASRGIVAPFTLWIEGQMLGRVKAIEAPASLAEHDKSETNKRGGKLVIFW